MLDIKVENKSYLIINKITNSAYKIVFDNSKDGKKIMFCDINRDIAYFKIPISLGAIPTNQILIDIILNYGKIIAYCFDKNDFIQHLFSKFFLQYINDIQFFGKHILKKKDKQYMAYEIKKIFFGYIYSVEINGELPTYMGKTLGYSDEGFNKIMYDYRNNEIQCMHCRNGECHKTYCNNKKCRCKVCINYRKIRNSFIVNSLNLSDNIMDRVFCGKLKSKNPMFGFDFINSYLSGWKINIALDLVLEIIITYYKHEFNSGDRLTSMTMMKLLESDNIITLFKKHCKNYKNCVNYYISIKK